MSGKKIIALYTFDSYDGIDHIRSGWTKVDDSLFSQDMSEKDALRKLSEDTVTILGCSKIDEAVKKSNGVIVMDYGGHWTPYGKYFLLNPSDLDTYAKEGYSVDIATGKPVRERHFQPADIEKIRNASSTAPVFAHGSFHDTRVDLSRYPSNVYGTADVAIIGYNAEKALIKTAVLSVDKNIDVPTSYKKLAFGQYGYPTIDQFSGVIVEPTERLAQLHAAFTKLHKETPFKASGRLYSLEPKYSKWDDAHNFPSYDDIPSTYQEWDLSGAVLNDGSPVDSLDAAKKWLIENHPAYWMGSYIGQGCVDGDFVCNVVPDAYGKGLAPKYEARAAVVALIAKDMGIEMGKETAQDVLNKMRDRRVKDAEQRTHEGEFMPEHDNEPLGME